MRGKHARPDYRRQPRYRSQCSRLPWQARRHVTDTAGDGVTGLHFAVVNNYDAIVLALKLTGIEVCRKLCDDGRKFTTVLRLTVRDTLPDKLKGLDSGRMIIWSSRLESRLQVQARGDNRFGIPPPLPGWHPGAPALQHSSCPPTSA